MFFHRNKKRQSNKSGFTLIELMVVLVIFVALTGIMMSSQSKFDNSILLDNLAYDIALSIREAQSYGVNVKESFLNNSSNFSGYGISFDLTNNDNKHYILFTDIHDTNNFYDGLSSCLTDDVECIKKYTLTRGSYIESVCAGKDENNCDNSTELNITYKRPNPDAHITKGPIGNTVPDQAYARIVISSANGTLKSIIVTALGDIYVK